MSDKLDLDALMKLAAEASPGPWIASDWSKDDGPDRHTVAWYEPETVRPGQSYIWPNRMRGWRVAKTDEGNNPLADAAFIAAARTAVPALVERVRELEALVARASEELRLIEMKDCGAIYDVGLRSELRRAALQEKQP